jgi:hypothetical protein
LIFIEEFLLMKDSVLYPVKCVFCRRLKGQSHQILDYILGSPKIKLVLFVGLFLVLPFSYFAVPEIFENGYLNCFCENTY